MNRQYTAFTKEFKLEALRLASQPNTCIAQLARDLGLRRNMILSKAISAHADHTSG